MAHEGVKHDYHLVNPSPWPLLGSVAALVLTMGGVMWMKGLFGEPKRASLETWTSLTWLASGTSRIRFGPLVCPLTFHHPALLAKRAAAALFVIATYSGAMNLAKTTQSALPLRTAASNLSTWFRERGFTG